MLFILSILIANATELEQWAQGTFYCQSTVEEVEKERQKAMEETLKASNIIIRTLAEPAPAQGANKGRSQCEGAAESSPAVSDFCKLTVEIGVCHTVQWMLKNSFSEHHSGSAEEWARNAAGWNPLYGSGVGVS